MNGLDDLTGAIVSVTGTLDAHGVPYFVAGSLASSSITPTWSGGRRSLGVHDLLDRFLALPDHP